jgi:hypothetical protein
MDNSVAGQGYQYGLNSSFQDGHNGNPYRVASTNGNSMSEKSNMPSSFTPQSVLQSSYYNTTGNGMSSQDASNILPGGYSAGNANGQSQESFNAAKYMRFLGVDAL